jgi:hypothetical protein
MPLVPTTIADGFNLNVGCAYWRDHDQLLLADGGNGTISAVNVHTHAKTVLGKGYGYLSDIVLSADGLHAYVMEHGGGNLLRLPLSNLDRAAAKVIASGLALHWGSQIGLDEAHGCAYIVDGTYKLTKINISTGAVSHLARIGQGTNRGVLASSDGRFVYVSDDSGAIFRYDLAAGTSTVVANGLHGPRYMFWADAGESTMVFVQNGPPGMVMKLDLTTPTPSLVPLAGPTADAPYSLALPSPDHLLVACGRVVGDVNLTSSIYNAAGPIFLAIGFVPADKTHLPGGYADTVSDTKLDPSYPKFKDAPFGGTLPLMINHDAARAMKANFYKVLIGPVKGKQKEVNQPYGDYCWNAALNRFEFKLQVPVNGFYALHKAGEIWLNYWLGAQLETGGQTNGLNTISIQLFGRQDTSTEIGSVNDSGRSATVMIDNTLPVASIDQILHDGSPVGTCAIVNSGSPNFSFIITAQAQRHLAGWSLVAYWGDNKSKKVDSDDYSHHISPPSSYFWTGVDHATVPLPPAPATWDARVLSESVPPVLVDPTSIRCAHTFWLNAWDRVINGWYHIHGWASYQKSITIWL